MGLMATSSIAVVERNVGRRCDGSASPTFPPRTGFVTRVTPIPLAACTYRALAARTTILAGKRATRAARRSPMGVRGLAVGGLERAAGGPGRRGRAAGGGRGGERRRGRP